MSSAAQMIHPQPTPRGETTHQSHPASNLLLWIGQALWGVFFSFTGFGKVLCYRADVWNMTLHQPVAWFHAVPQGLFVFIGVAEFLGGAGLILPELTRVKPKLTPLAAIGLALVMVLAAIFHIVRGEIDFFVPMNLLLASGAAFIAYGWWKVRLNAAAPTSPLRLIAGVVVAVALALAGFAPIWYQLTHAQ